MNVYIPLYLGDFVSALSRCVVTHEGFVSAVYVPTLRLCSSYILQVVHFCVMYFLPKCIKGSSPVVFGRCYHFILQE